MITKPRELTEAFYTLEEFLCLPEYAESPDREWGASMHGTEWLFRYRLAQEMWALYGRTLLPIGSELQILVSGFGTTMPSVQSLRDVARCPRRKIIDNDGAYYTLSDGVGRYLLDKPLWWRSVAIL